MSSTAVNELTEEQASADVPNWHLVRLDHEQFAHLHQDLHPILEGVYDQEPGGMSPQSLFNAVANDEMQLWVVTDGYEIAGAIGTSLATLITNKKVCKIHFFAGHHSAQWLHLLSQIEAWASYEGCSSMEVRARKSWARRLPNYKLTHIVLERDL